MDNNDLIAKLQRDICHDFHQRSVAKGTSPESAANINLQRIAIQNPRGNAKCCSLTQAASAHPPQCQQKRRCAYRRAGCDEKGDIPRAELRFGRQAELSRTFAR
jgi:hypothetical protein